MIFFQQDILDYFQTQGFFLEIDIGLIILKFGFTPNKAVNIICLPLSCKSSDEKIVSLGK